VQADLSAAHVGNHEGCPYLPKGEAPPRPYNGHAMACPYGRCP
jgi:hypothetical protein